MSQPPSVLKKRCELQLPTMLFLVLAAGCAAREPLVVDWSFANGTYAEVLREAFGASVLRSVVNYFVLPNAWAPVEPNGLSIQHDRVRYVELNKGQRTVFDVAPDSCAQLADAVEGFHKRLETVIPNATGELAYDDPSYLDGPNYVVELHASKATVVIDPKGSLGGNFPLIVAAENVKRALRVCDENQRAGV